MTDKFPCVLRIAGLSLCVVCTVYMLYFTVSRKAVSVLEESGAKALTIGMMAVTEGEVVRADDEYTIIRYYYEWDGTDYKKVRPYAIPGCQEGMRMPVVYSIGMGPGMCLTVGVYRKPVQILGVAGAVLLLPGLMMNFRKKG